MKRIYLWCLALILLVGSVSAQGCPANGFMGTFEKSQNVTITETCPTCDFITITVKSPSSTILVSNNNMTLVNGVFQFNLSGSSANFIGTYFVEGFSNLDDPFIACFDVNQTGIEFDNLWMNFLIIFLLSFGAFTLIYVFNESRSAINHGDGNFIYYYLGAFMLFSIGIYTLLFGFGGYITLLTEALGWVVWGSGLFFLTRPYFVGGKWQW